MNQKQFSQSPTLRESFLILVPEPSIKLHPPGPLPPAPFRLKFAVLGMLTQDFVYL
jgi:hypothetical protein